MKKAFLLATLFLMAISFIGCSKKDAADYNKLIVGTWKITSHIIVYYDGSNKVLYTKTEDLVKNPYSITYKSDGNITDSDNEKGTWKITGSDFTLSSRGFTSIFTIQKLDNTDFIITSTNTTDVSYNDGSGNKPASKLIQTVSFKKQ